MLGAAVAWVLSSRADPAAPAVPIRFDVQRVQEEPLGVATRNLALSPDGTRLAYATVSSLRLRAMGGGGCSVARSSGAIRFFRRTTSGWRSSRVRPQAAARGRRRIGANHTGAGTERTLGGTWGADGTIVISLGGRLLRVSAKGGPLEPVAEPDAARGEVRFAWPEFLPDGRSVLFTILGAGADRRCANRCPRSPTRQDDHCSAGRTCRTLSADGTSPVCEPGTAHVVAFDLRASTDSWCPGHARGHEHRHDSRGIQREFRRVG